jgi:hypothetical protein
MPKLALIHFFPVIPVFFLYSCVARYGAGNMGSASRFLSKPGYEDSLKSGHYVGGSFYFNEGNGHYDGERSSFGEVFYHYGVSRKHFAFAAGGGLYQGRYQVRFWEQAPGNYSFYGGNITLEMAPNLVFDKNRSRIFKLIQWRILGIRATTTFEDGSFFRFRSRQDSAPGFENLNKHLFFHHLALTSELDFDFKNFRFGLFGANGISFNRDRIFALFFSGGVSISHRRFTLSNQFNAGSRQGTNFSSGLTYRF